MLDDLGSRDNLWTRVFPVKGKLERLSRELCCPICRHAVPPGSGFPSLVPHLDSAVEVLFCARGAKFGLVV